MSGFEQVRSRVSGLAEDRSLLRRWIAALCAACAVVYFAIGFEWIRVVSEPRADGPSPLTFGLMTGLAFALGTVVMLSTDRISLEAIGAAFMVVVLVGYVLVAPSRTPSFEEWGIALKVAQAAVLAGLVFLIAAPAGRSADGQRSRIVR